MKREVLREVAWRVLLEEYAPPHLSDIIDDSPGLRCAFGAGLADDCEVPDPLQHAPESVPRTPGARDPGRWTDPGRITDEVSKEGAEEADEA